MFILSSDIVNSVFVVGGESVCKHSIVRELVNRGYDVYCGVGEARDAAAIGAQGATIHQLDTDDPDTVTNSINTLLRLVSTVDGLIMMPERGVFGSIEEADVGDVENLFYRNIIIPKLFLESILPFMRSQQRGSLVLVNREMRNHAVGISGWMRSFDVARTALIETLRTELGNAGIKCFKMQTQLDAECFDGVHQLIHDTNGHSSFYQPQIDAQLRSLRDSDEGVWRCSSFANQVCDLLPARPALAQINQTKTNHKLSDASISGQVGKLLSWFQRAEE